MYPLIEPIDKNTEDKYLRVSNVHVSVLRGPEVRGPESPPHGAPGRPGA